MIVTPIGPRRRASRETAGRGCPLKLGKERPEANPGLRDGTELSSVSRPITFNMYERFPPNTVPFAVAIRNVRLMSNLAEALQPASISSAPRSPQGLRASIVTDTTPWPPRLELVTTRTELPEISSCRPARGRRGCRCAPGSGRDANRSSRPRRTLGRGGVKIMQVIKRPAAASAPRGQEHQHAVGRGTAEFHNRFGAVERA